MGVLLAGLAARGIDAAFNLSERVGPLAGSNLVAMAVYVLFLAVPLYLVARRGEQAR